jgi:DNA-binding transcriptional MerR regulator
VEGAIPSEKLYFKIGEVAKIVGVKPYVLRYWETEFSVIRPGKTRSQHRLYRRKDVETLLQIKELLHKKRFTIEGARRHLRGATQGQSSTAKPKVSGDLKALREIRDSLVDLRETLS